MYPEPLAIPWPYDDDVKPPASPSWYRRPEMIVTSALSVLTVAALIVALVIVSKSGQEHLQLRGQYPGVRLLWSGDWSTFSASNFWVSIAGISFPDAGGALAWCTSQGFDRDHCFAKIVSTTHPVDGSTAYN